MDYSIQSGQGDISYNTFTIQDEQLHKEDGIKMMEVVTANRDSIQ
ncbi:MAG: hypothetical protein WAM14_25075 [Candidatus Nitrosopolaris sp.]